MVDGLPLQYAVGTLPLKIKCSAQHGCDTHAFLMLSGWSG